jgi:hypothetical protein
MRRRNLRARAETSGWPKRDCAIIPETKTRNPFDSFLQFVFETVFRLIASATTTRCGKALPMGQTCMSAATQSNNPGNRFCQSLCSLRCWSISRAFVQRVSREIPSDSKKCSQTSSFLTMWRASVRSASMNCSSFMAYGYTKLGAFS